MSDRVQGIVLGLLLSAQVACADVSQPEAGPSANEAALLAAPFNHGRLSFAAAARLSGARGGKAGCPSPEPVCLFGETFYQLRSEGLLTVVYEHWLRAPSELSSELEAQQLVIAVQQSSHTDVTTAAEAFAAVDQNEVRRMRLRDAPSGREYDVFEYGAGDNSYGAIFRADTRVKAASIHDGDLLECTEF